MGSEGMLIPNVYVMKAMEAFGCVASTAEDVVRVMAREARERLEQPPSALL